MELFHDSHDRYYRDPFGALPTGGSARLRLRICGPEPEQVHLRIFSPRGENLLPMEWESREGNESVYRITLPAGETPGLLWYDFIAEGNGERRCFSNSREGLGGPGENTPEPVANSYQITVYDKNYTTPAWFRDRIMYQIFPDRFWGEHGPEGIVKKREEYIVHQDWNEPMTFQKHPYEEGPACNDFYGGNLAGIRARLPYLRSLGVGVIYLNPIFEAYSNHRYDTANYKKIDPMLGNEQDFRDLCAEAEKFGIKIVLDGVFSHTGADSIYFNKYGNYGRGQGAWQDPDSPYRAWYQFTDYPQYQSWWGCTNLPNVRETEPSYLDYMLREEDAVIKKWIREGAAGWRLDVADELPEPFIRMLREQLKAENPEAVLIGEVWEDASHKIAYGALREYLFGGELDSVMNYPFREQVLGFLLGEIPAQDMSRRFLSQMENYPLPALYSLMNILGTHDTARVKSVLGGMNPDCGDARLEPEQEALAVKRLKLGAFMQMTFYGVPCIYYGDEAGMQGGRDPYNRGAFPWQAEDNELLEWYRSLGKIRNESDCLRRGGFWPLYARGDLYLYLRWIAEGRDAFGLPGRTGVVLCGVNRGNQTQTAELDLSKTGKLRRVLGEGPETLDQNCRELTLPPLSAVLYQQMQ